MRRLRIILFFMCFLPLVCQAQDIEKHKARIRELQHEIEVIDDQLAANQKSRKTNTAELALIRKKIANQKKIIGSIEGQIKEYNRKISEKSEEIEQAQREIQDMLNRYRHLVQESYKIRDSKMWFMYVIASDSFSEGFRRWKYLKNISVSLKKKTDDIRDRQEELQKEKNRLQALKDEAFIQKAEKQKEYNRLNATKAESDRILKDLTRKEKNLKKQITAKKKETDKLNREIEKIIAETARKAEKQKNEAEKKGEYKSSVDYRLSGDFLANKGKIPWPVERGIVIEKFGENAHPVHKNIKTLNNGINISAPAGSPARAVFDGTVAQVIILTDNTYCVVIKHGTYLTGYSNMNSVEVRIGQTVHAGDVIGTPAVKNGNALLHFELWKGSQKQNPEIWLK